MTIHTAPPGDHFVGSFAPIPPTLPPYRLALEAEIERMIEMLDSLDGDPDLEPSLGGETMGAEVDLEGGDDDREPALGSFDRMLNQENWSRSTGWHGLGEDRELDDCDREDGGDSEPDDDRELDDADKEHSLGWPEAGIGGVNTDLEVDVPTGFRRVRRDLAVECDAMAEANRDLRRIIGRLSGNPTCGSTGRSNVVPVTLVGPDGRLYSAARL